MDHDLICTIRRKPIDKLVTVRRASQIVNTPIEILKHELKEHGIFQDERYIISLPASHTEAKEDTKPFSPIIPPWRRK